MADQLDTARAERAPDLGGLLTGNDTWVVEA
jgi:hypothetical protein